MSRFNVLDKLFPKPKQKPSSYRKLLTVRVTYKYKKWFNGNEVWDKCSDNVVHLLVEPSTPLHLVVFEADDLFRELRPEALEFSFTGIVATGPTAYLKKEVPSA